MPVEMSSNYKEDRVSVKIQCPNPLFEKWLEEWRDEAMKKNSKTHHAYSLALQSLRKYPLPLQKPRDCNLLKGFGRKLCDMLEDRLKQYKREGIVEYDVITEIATTSKPKKKTLKRGITENNTSITYDNNEYIPKYKSGAYAIMVALYQGTLEKSLDSMLKKDLIRVAQYFCDTSFTKAKPGTYYTAWNCMRTLICKNLVKKEGSPAKYSLTNEGIIIAHKLYTKKNSDQISPLSSSTNVDNTLQQIFLDKKFSEMSSDVDNQNIHFNDFKEDLVESLDFCIPKPVIAASSELRGICGTFSSLETENKETDRIKDNVKNIVEHQDFLLSPYSFEVILYVDTQESSGSFHRGQIDPLDDPIIAELRHLDVNFEVRNLKVGDYCWICRDRKSAVELVTPYIIERKRMDDLAASIKDGRFYEQKFRLKQCGLQNVIYMIESYGTKDEHVGLPLNALYQATVNTLVQDGFCVKFVEGVRGVAEFLSCMSNLIKRNYESKILTSCPRENISNISITDDLVSLMFFTEFNKLSSKAKNFTVKEMFIKELLQVKGLSIDKALAIVEVYPTPQSLSNAFKENGPKIMNIISNMKYGKLGKKIGPILGNIIYQLFTKSLFQ